MGGKFLIPPRHKIQRHFSDSVADGWPRRPEYLERLAERIQEVEMLIFERLQALTFHTDHNDERQTLADASSLLRVLKKQAILEFHAKNDPPNAEVSIRIALAGSSGLATNSIRRSRFRRQVLHNFQNLILPWPFLIQRLGEPISLPPIGAYRHANVLAVLQFASNLVTNWHDGLISSLLSVLGRAADERPRCASARYSRPSSRAR
jgi:hypothetical protein